MESDRPVFPFVKERKGVVRMGVQKLDFSDWIRIDTSYLSHMKVKKEVLGKHMDEAFVSVEKPSTRAAMDEALDMLFDHLPDRFPKVFKKLEDGKIKNLLTGEIASPSAKDSPIAQSFIEAAKLVEEDLCILEYSPEHKTYDLTGGMVTFPMRWNLIDKVGLPMFKIHVPVKEYMEHLQHNVANLFDDLEGGKGVSRANWAVFNDMHGPLDLWTPEATRTYHGQVAKYGNGTGDEVFLRCEYQTIVKMPKTKAILFTIRTYQTPLKDLSPEIAKHLIRAIEELDPAMAIYKGANLFKDATIQYLREDVLEKAKAKL